MMPYLTRYSFATGVDGNFSVQQHPLLNPPPLGCPIPRDLSLPTINISQLRRISSWTGMNSFHLIHIDPDECDTYIFKHIPAEDLIRAPEGAIKRRSHALLSEVELLTTGALAKSPFVAKPSLVVVDDSNILRGYLIPYEIEMALGKLLDDCGGLPDKHMVLLDAEVSNRDEIPPCFTWETKLAWAIGVVEGLADMHASGICHGDLTTFAIDLSQGYKIVYNSIDFGFSLVYNAPDNELNMVSGEPKEPLETLLTPARDVFALGLVLWSISEEIYMFLRMPNLKPRLLWADDGRTPEWYRELVEACVDSDPNQRPDVDSVLNELVAHIQ